MARTRTYIPLNVFLNGRLVGRLTKEPGGAIHFVYHQSWLTWENALPVSLSLPLREDQYAGRAVAAVFENLLPDSEEIRHRLAARVKAEGSDAYSLLTALGRDCVGALQFLPDGLESGPVGQLEGRRLSDKEIAAILGDLNKTPLGVTDEREFRISLAGAQEKTALLLWKDKWHIPHGSTATTHILKPQIGARGNIDLSQSVENEHLCMKLTAGIGLPTARTEIADFGGRRALVVERFDRRWTRDRRLLRLPQEDCCQALSVPPTLKYQADGGPGMVDILKLLMGSDDPEADRRNFMKAQIVFWLLGATDGHAKNFSIFLSPAGRFQMTPLYDVMSAQPAVDAGQMRRNRMKLALAVGKNNHYVIDTIMPRHFIQTGEAAGMPASLTQDIMSELVARAPAAVETTRQELSASFPEVILHSIGSGMLHRLRRLKSVDAAAGSTKD
ncbi:MAG TPA: type II toxin-antitoxin system HipA family toxin [Candidatus Angelobacter sp.]|nr:type II toxin-antitoxin system HipA family toxin [Candidatus Angelobacter sp.]